MGAGEQVSEEVPEKGPDQNQKPPFFHSDKYTDVLRKTRKEVSSRYKSSPPPTVKRRYPSPDISRTTISSISLPKRAHSTERRRPSPAPASPVALPPSVDMKLISRKAASISQDALWPSTRQSRDTLPLDNTIPKPHLNVHRKGAEALARNPLNVLYPSHVRQSKESAYVYSTLPKSRLPSLPGGGFSQNRPPTLERVDRLLQRFDTSTPCVDSLSSSERFKPSTPITRTQTMPVLGGKIAGEIIGRQTKAFTPSLSRWQSPRVRQSSSSNQLNRLSSSSVLSLVENMRKRNKCLNHLEYVHHLRLLHNRHLQWQYVNAQADRTSSLQKATNEKTLFNAWSTLQPLFDSVENTNTHLRWLRLTCRLKSLLNAQIRSLGDWDCHRRDYDSALDGATEDLRAVVFLPVIGAKAETATLEPVLRSAMDLMRAMESRGSLHTMVEGMKCLVRELAEMSSKERVVVEELEAQLASVESLQIEEQSLRAQLITAVPPHY